MSDTFVGPAGGRSFSAIRAGADLAETSTRPADLTTEPAARSASLSASATEVLPAEPPDCWTTWASS
jgi:hypothetical protein